MSLHQACALLDVTTSCDDATELRRCYLAAIRISHPDRNSAADAHLRTTQLSEAYRLLCAALEEHASLGDAMAADGAATDRVGETGHAASPPQRQTAGAHGHGFDPDSPEAETYEIEGWVRIIANDTIELGAPLDLAFRWLEIACHRAGDITYLDRPAALLQLLVEFEGFPLCYVVFDLQGRAAYGTTEVFCSIASLDDRQPPPIEAVTEYLAVALDEVLQ